MDIFKGIFDTDLTTVISVGDFLLCLLVSLLCGGLLTVGYSIKNTQSKSFALTLGLLPAVVCVVMMAVNGNIGVGVAVAGAFSLVRFRSAAGSAQEICVLFLAMASGLMAGVGYLGYAVLFTVVMSVLLVAVRLLMPRFAHKNTERSLRITVPEDLDYTTLFDDIFEQYTTASELESVKTTNMGSLFKLTYRLTMKDASKEKEMIDALRCRNGNLEISISYQPTAPAEL